MIEATSPDIRPLSFSARDAPALSLLMTVSKISVIANRTNATEMDMLWSHGMMPYMYPRVEVIQVPENNGRGGE